jgi:hypothetical protein
MYFPCSENLTATNCANKTFNDTLNYLGSLPEFYILHNIKRFDLNDFSSQSTVITESVLTSFHLQMLQASTMTGIV